MEEIFDFGIVASFGYFIPARIINSFKKGMLNAHPSLLPKYRGASPLQYTIMNGDTTSGVSIIDLDSKEFDAGNIWLQSKVDIEPFKDFRKLESMLANLSGDLIYECLTDFDALKINAYSQPGTVTFSPKITRQDALINFRNMRCLKIFGKFQALRHQEVIHSKLEDGKEIFLIDIIDPRLGSVTSMFPDQWESLQAASTPGSIYWERQKKIIWIKCLDGWVGCRLFRIQGKSNTFDAGNFFNALKLKNITNPHFL